MKNLETGRAVRNIETTETGTILYRTELFRMNGPNTPAYRIQVDVNPDDWKHSVIGPPSGVSATWEAWVTVPAEWPEDD